MAVLEVVNGSYSNVDAVERVCTYVLDPVKTKGLIGGCGVLPEFAIIQIETIKKIWCKEHGRQMRHFVLSFGEQDVVCLPDIWEIAQRLALYYFEKGYQIIFGIHLNTEHQHVHFAFNTVSFIDGKMYSGGRTDYWALQRYAEQVLKEYGVRLGWSDPE